MASPALAMPPGTEDLIQMRRRLLGSKHGTQKTRYTDTPPAPCPLVAPSPLLSLSEESDEESETDEPDLSSAGSARSRSKQRNYGAVSTTSQSKAAWTAGPLRDSARIPPAEGSVASLPGEAQPAVPRALKKITTPYPNFDDVEVPGSPSLPSGSQSQEPPLTPSCLGHGCNPPQQQQQQINDNRPTSIESLGNGSSTTTSAPGRPINARGFPHSISSPASESPRHARAPAVTFHFPSSASTSAAAPEPFSSQRQRVLGAKQGTISDRRLGARMTSACSLLEPEEHPLLEGELVEDDDEDEPREPQPMEDMEGSCSNLPQCVFEAPQEQMDVEGSRSCLPQRPPNCFSAAGRHDCPSPQGESSKLQHQVKLQQASQPNPGSQHLHCDVMQQTPSPGGPHNQPQFQPPSEHQEPSEPDGELYARARTFQGWQEQGNTAAFMRSNTTTPAGRPSRCSPGSSPANSSGSSGSHPPHAGRHLRHRSGSPSLFHGALEPLPRSLSSAEAALHGALSAFETPQKRSSAESALRGALPPRSDLLACRGDAAAALRSLSPAAAALQRAVPPRADSHTFRGDSAALLRSLSPGEAALQRAATCNTQRAIPPKADSHAFWGDSASPFAGLPRPRPASPDLSCRRGAAGAGLPSETSRTISSAAASVVARLRTASADPGVTRLDTSAPSLPLHGRCMSPGVPTFSLRSSSGASPETSASEGQVHGRSSYSRQLAQAAAAARKIAVASSRSSGSLESCCSGREATLPSGSSRTPSPNLFHSCEEDEGAVLERRLTPARAVPRSRPGGQRCARALHAEVTAPSERCVPAVPIDLKEGRTTSDPGVCRRMGCP